MKENPPTDKITSCRKLLTIDQQIDKLIDDGLIIKDRAKAKRFLQLVNLNKLEIYFNLYRRKDRKFQEGTEFEYVVDLYYFNYDLCDEVSPANRVVEDFLKALLYDYFTNLPELNGDAFFHLKKDFYKPHCNLMN